MSSLSLFLETDVSGFQGNYSALNPQKLDMLPLNSHSSQEKGNLRGVPERIKETSANCRKEEENPWLRSQRANVKTACQFQRVLSILSHWPAAKAAFRALEVLPPSGTAAVIGKDQLVQSFNPRGFLQQFYLSI